MAWSEVAGVTGETDRMVEGLEIVTKSCRAGTDTALKKHTKSCNAAHALTLRQRAPRVKESITTKGIGEDRRRASV